MRRFLAIFSLVTLVLCAEQQGEKMPCIFHADFSVAQPLPGWGMNVGGMVENGTLRLFGADRKMARVQFGESKWENLELTFRARIVHERRGDRHWGVDLCAGGGDAIKVFCRGERFEALSQGKVSVFPVPLSRKMAVGPDTGWTAISITCKDGEVAVKADNASLGAIPVPRNAHGMVVLYAYGMDIEIENLAVCLLSQNETEEVKAPQSAMVSGNSASPNVLFNSGFETCTLDNLPDCWGCFHWGIGAEWAILDHARWHRNYQTVTDNPWEGERCMRIVREDHPSTGEVLLRSCIVNTKKEIPYTLSAYLRSDTEGFPASLGGKRVLVSREWSRHTVPFVNHGKGIAQDMVAILPLAKGTLWVDAVQLEMGNEATEYRPAEKDRKILAFDGDVEKKIHDVPRLALPFRKASIQLDGRLDDEVWSSLEPLPLNDVEGRPVSPQSQAYLWSDGTGLYIGVKCATDEQECKITDRDGYFWLDPVVEVFLDTRFTRSIYHHFAVTKNNVQYDSYCQVPAWNAKWQSSTYRPKDGSGWSAELYLPFGILDISQENQSVWGMNICFNENHHPVCWAPTFGNFHNPQRFAQLEIPLDVQREFFFRTPSVEALASGKDQVTIAVKVANDTGRSASLRVEAEAGGHSGVKELTLSAGERRSVELLTIPPLAEEGKDIPITVRVYEGDVLRNFHTTSVKMPELFSAQLQYAVTDRPELLLRVEHRLPTAQSSHCTVMAKAEGKSITTALQSNPTMLRIPIADEECKGVVAVTLLGQDGSPLAERRLPFQKLASGHNGVFCDQFTRMLSVDGKPFFPIGFATEVTPTTAVIRHWASIGCNSITLGMARIPEWRLSQILKEAKQCGVYIRAGIPGRDIEKSRNIILKYRDEPAILCWNVLDEEFTREWGQKNYAKIQEIVRQLQECDPWHPILINENEPGLNFLVSKGLDFPGPIVSVDAYAWGETPNYFRYADLAELMWNLGKSASRPAWIYLLGAGYAYWAKRDHTPKEHRFMAYSCIIHGVTAIYYWADYPKSPSCLSAIKQIFREASALTPILACQNESAPKVTCSSPRIDFTTRIHDGALHIIALNKNENAPVTARFTIDGFPAKEAEAMFEQRLTSIQDNVFEDTFAPWSSHVYRITPPSK